MHQKIILNLEENFEIVVEQAIKGILKSTVQLLIASPTIPGSVEPFGSSVLFMNEGQHYLLTAAHCIHQGGKLTNVGFNDNKGNLVYLLGDAFIINDKDDQIDMSLVHLTNLTALSLKESGYIFLNKHQLFRRGCQALSLDYIVVGFPVNKTKIRGAKKIIDITPFKYVTKSASLKEYKKLGFSEKDNLLLNYNRRRGTHIGSSEKMIGPWPAGMSGCGVWHIPSYFVEDVANAKYNLAGILTEFHHEHNMLVSGKIENIFPYAGMF